VGQRHRIGEKSAQLGLYSRALHGSRQNTYRKLFSLSAFVTRNFFVLVCNNGKS
jgi:hypothetical protein